jgi:hypothetical protein
MKRIIPILLLFLCTIAYSQSKDQTDIGREGTLFFKDGTEQKGFIKLDKRDDIWFRKNKDSSEVFYKKNKIERFNTISNKETLRNYHYGINPKKKFSNIVLIDEDKDLGTLFFKNGTQKNGIIEFKKGNILFKENKDSDEKVYTFNDVYKLNVNNDNGDNDDYEYKLVVEKNKTKVYLMQPKIHGKVSLYIRDVEASYQISQQNPFGPDSYYRGNRTLTEYYLSKENDMYATKIILSNLRNNHFRLNIAPIFFSDCEYLMGMIMRRSFEKDDFEGLVNYYNNSERCN